MLTTKYSTKDSLYKNHSLGMLKYLLRFCNNTTSIPLGIAGAEISIISGNFDQTRQRTHDEQLDLNKQLSHEDIYGEQRRYRANRMRFQRR